MTQNMKKICRICKKICKICQFNKHLKYIPKYAKYVINMQNMYVKIDYAEYALHTLLMTQAPTLSTGVTDTRTRRSHRTRKSTLLILRRSLPASNTVGMSGWACARPTDLPLPRDFNLTESSNNPNWAGQAIVPSGLLPRQRTRRVHGRAGILTRTGWTT